MRRGKALMVMANEKGEIFEHPFFEAVGTRDKSQSLMKKVDLIPLPEGTEIFHLPGTKPVGYNPESGNIENITKFHGENVVACSALLVQGYTRTYLPSSIKRPHYKKKELPLWAWTSVGWNGEGFVVPAFRSDPDSRMDPGNYEDQSLFERVEKRLAIDPDNPILQQLKKCATEYFCLAAQNVFLERWECPMPVSSTCNSQCLGCISKQLKGRIDSPQQRLNYIPHPDDIYKIAAYHLERIPNGIISFGQGCEGDPILRTKEIVPAIERLRDEFPLAALNMNTNASQPENIKKLVKSGLNSVRISMNSVREDFYNAYYSPKGYNINDVLASIKYCAENNVYTAINYLVFPGINDRPEEIEPLMETIEKTGLQMIQLRNLNIDPDIYLPALPKRRGNIIGLDKLRDALKKEFPHLDIGYYNRSRMDFVGYSKESNKFVF